MQRLRERLIETYTEHYARVNESIDPTKITADRVQHMEVTYRELIDPLPNGARVLDLGCGTGMLLSWLSRQSGIAPVGVDSSPSQVALAQRYLPNVELHCEDGLEFLSAHPDEFDAIFCTDVLEHIPGKDNLLQWVEAATAALKPNGSFYCRMPNAASLVGSFTRYMDLTHECSFTSTSIVQLLEAGGLRDCRVMAVRGEDLSARIRLWVEHWMHRVIHRICGHAMERVFTTNVCAVGYRRIGESTPA